MIPQFPCHRLIRASAGSGKTYDLVHRYIGLVALGVDPTRILATTFTRKAAGEILGRILLRLADAAIDPEERAEMNRSLPSPLDGERAEALLGSMCRRLPELQIETLDAVFHRIASVHSLELDLPPDWKIGDQATLARIRQRAIHDWLERDPAVALEVMRRLSRGDLQRSVTKQVDQLIVELHSLWIESPEAAWDTIVVPAAPGDEELKKAIGLLKTLTIPQTKAGTPRKRYQNAHKKILEALETADYSQLIKQTLIQRILDRSGRFDSCEIPASWNNALEAPIECARHQELKRLAQQNRASRDLLTAYDRLEITRKDDQGLYDFLTVTRRIAERRLTEEIHAVYEKIDTRIDHLLLDEFQDTSLLQWCVLAPIVEELSSGPPLERSIFCVGDAKQAIYGWRGGRRELFDVVEHYLGPDSCQSKEVSYRSSPVILEVVNKVFSKVELSFDDEQDAETAREWRADFPQHRAHQKNLPGYAELRIARADSTENGSTEYSAYLRAIETVLQLQNRDPHCSIGVLLRKNDLVAPLIDLLREEGVDASQDGGNPLTDSPAVNRLLACLTMADHPGDRASAFAVIESRLGEFLGLDDPTDVDRTAKVGRQLRADLLQRGYGETVARLAKAIAPSCDDRDRFRLEQLIRLAARFDGERGLRPREFIERVTQTPIESPSGSPVKVMTMHRSKGLEFDAVILPQLADSWLSPTPKVLAAASNPILPADRITRYPNEELRLLCPEQLDPIYQLYRKERITEAISLLYVALTRARHGLYLWIPELKKEGKSLNFAKLLHRSLCSDRDEESDQKPDSGHHVEPPTFQAGDEHWVETLKRTSKPEPPRSADVPIEPTMEPSDDAIFSKLAGTRDSLPPPSQRQSTSVETSAVDPLNLAKRRRARRLGVAFHRLIESITWIEAENPSALLKQKVNSLVGEFFPFAEPALVAVLQLLQIPAVEELFSRRDTDARLSAIAGEEPDRIECERELLYGRVPPNAPNPEIGIVDRCHIAWSHDTPIAAEILDIKTTGIKAPNDVELERIRERSTLQLEAYRSAIGELFQLEASRIEAKLLIVPGGQIIPISSD